MSRGARARRVGLTPAPGSSSRMRVGSAIMVRPSSRSFFWPPDRVPAGSSRRCEIELEELQHVVLGLVSDLGFACAALSLARTQAAVARCARPGWAGGTTVMRLSRTVRLGKLVRDLERAHDAMWNISWVGRPPMSRPSKMIRPDEGLSSPAIRLNVVVLPAPFGPMRPVMVPAVISNVQSRTACRPPKCMFRLSTLSKTVPPVRHPRQPVPPDPPPARRRAAVRRLHRAGMMHPPAGRYQRNPVGGPVGGRPGGREGPPPGGRRRDAPERLAPSSRGAPRRGV